ncbi:oxygen-independent coproporphyrinogen-3 oxidase [Jatrophihabitans sp. GAS493]|uniref:radical SAM family heme chaperone HemW n=1 Tax=Jatrophihabitans sp. GAS493 TaxID=1907575 RepID=UPI000BB90712|nr:radical SAM family heme chaperone HemW [Jatrophihabitans sp. GAS493]SOD74718.1 oxygen-independent coproporphyrinogen-3 oxidase [Jatrophihabitans sp. GAS493]
MAVQPQGDTPPRDGRLPRESLQNLRITPFGVYVHIPFCQTRCGYCDFNTYTAAELGPGVSRGSYADTVLSELRLARQVLDGNLPAVSTVFFGGGTPTLLPAEHLGLILREIDELFGLVPDAEVTTEANPESVTPKYFEKLREAGFTRVSLGMQSAVPKVLEVLDRKHRSGRPEEAVAEARAAGFEHVNLDLIYGAPYETDADWQASLDAAIGADPDHISAYSLIVEEGTALARQIAQGVVPAPDDDAMADRYLQADQAMAAAGYHWYEVSNWAKNADAICRHNILYWRDANWWGVGPGAHSHIDGVRWWNVKHPVRYSSMLETGGSPAIGRETLDAAARHTEKIMLGVRLGEGLSMLDLDEQAQQKVPQLVSWGLVETKYFDAGRVVLTQRGRLMADAVVRELTP